MRIGSFEVEREAGQGVHKQGVEPLPEAAPARRSFGRCIGLPGAIAANGGSVLVKAMRTGDPTARTKIVYRIARPLDQRRPHLGDRQRRDPPWLHPPEATTLHEAVRQGHRFGPFAGIIGVRTTATVSGWRCAVPRKFVI